MSLFPTIFGIFGFNDIHSFLKYIFCTNFVLSEINKVKSHWTICVTMVPDTKIFILRKKGVWKNEPLSVKVFCWGSQLPPSPLITQGARLIFYGSLYCKWVYYSEVQIFGKFQKKTKGKEIGSRMKSKNWNRSINSNSNH